MSAAGLVPAAVENMEYYSGYGMPCAASYVCGLNEAEISIITIGLS